MAKLPTIDPGVVLLAAFDENTASLRGVNNGTAGPVVEHDLDPAQVLLAVFDETTRGLRVVNV